MASEDTVTASAPEQQLPDRSEAKQGTSLKTCKRGARNETQTLMTNVSSPHYSQHSASGPPTRKYDGRKSDKNIQNAHGPKLLCSAKLFAVASAKYLHMLKV